MLLKLVMILNLLEKFWRCRISSWIISKNKAETKLKQAFASNMSIDMKLSKFQIPKIIQCGGSSGSWSVNLGRKALANVAIAFTGDFLPGLVNNIASNVVNKFERRSRKGVVTAGKGFTLFISNEDIDYIKIVKSLEDWEVLIDGVTEAIKHDFFLDFLELCYHL